MKHIWLILANLEYMTTQGDITMDHIHDRLRWLFSVSGAVGISSVVLGAIVDTHMPAYTWPVLLCSTLCFTIAFSCLIINYLIDRQILFIFAQVENGHKRWSLIFKTRTWTFSLGFMPTDHFRALGGDPDHSYPDVPPSPPSLGNNPIGGDSGPSLNTSPMDRPITDMHIMADGLRLLSLRLTNLISLNSGDNNGQS